VGVDHFLAHNCSCASGCDFLACEVSEGAAFVLDSTVWVAFLGGLCRVHLATAVDRHPILRTLDGGEALIGECIPQNIARRQLNWWHEVVSERGLLARREARNVRRRVPAVLFARLGIHNGLAQPFVAVAPDHTRGAACSSGSFLLAVGEFHRWGDFRQHGSRVGGVGIGAGTDGQVAHPYNGGNCRAAADEANTPRTEGPCQD
jgi:hypothetical protein